MRNDRSNRHASIFIAAAAVLLALGCAEEPTVGETAPPAPSATAAGPLDAPPTTTNAEALQASAGDVVRDPNQYVGRVVTVTGDVEEVASPRAFTIDTGITPGDLLVLSRTPVPGVTEGGTTRAILADDDVIVTGRVHIMNIAEIETEVGWDLEQELEVEFANQPVLIIDTMTATANAQGQV